MARAPTIPSPPPKSSDELRRGLKRLREAREALETFDVSSVSAANNSALERLRSDIASAVDRAFVEGASEHGRFIAATYIRGVHGLRMGGGPPSDSSYRENVSKDISTSKALLDSAISTIERDLEDLATGSAPVSLTAAPEPGPSTNRVFIVHGRSDGPKNTVRGFIRELGLEPIILHEQPNAGRSAIEKIEAFGDVAFAIVIFTPDDIGALSGEEVAARPRQNVLFELGYFIGRLTRAKVCVLRQGEMEMLSDYVGPIWVDFDSPGAWKATLVRELRAAGFEIKPDALIKALGL